MPGSIVRALRDSESMIWRDVTLPPNAGAGLQNDTKRWLGVSHCARKSAFGSPLALVKVPPTKSLR
jgi:hypothetical protein